MTLIHPTDEQGVPQLVDNEAEEEESSEEEDEEDDDDEEV